MNESVQSNGMIRLRMNILRHRFDVVDPQQAPQEEDLIAFIPEVTTGFDPRGSYPILQTMEGDLLTNIEVNEDEEKYIWRSNDGSFRLPSSFPFDGPVEYRLQLPQFSSTQWYPLRSIPMRTVHVYTSGMNAKLETADFGHGHAPIIEYTARIPACYQLTRSYEQSGMHLMFNTVPMHHEISAPFTTLDITRPDGVVEHYPLTLASSTIVDLLTHPADPRTLEVHPVHLMVVDSQHGEPRVLAVREHDEHDEHDEQSQGSKHPWKLLNVNEFNRFDPYATTIDDPHLPENAKLTLRRDVNTHDEDLFDDAPFMVYLNESTHHILVVLHASADQYQTVDQLVQASTVRDFWDESLYDYTWIPASMAGKKMKDPIDPTVGNDLEAYTTGKVVSLESIRQTA